MLLHRDPDTAIRALEGMFAFALFDSHDRSLLMARDRFGMKPLFIQQVGEAFLFGSEVKAFAPWTAPSVALHGRVVSAELPRPDQRFHLP